MIVKKDVDSISNPAIIIVIFILCIIELFFSLNHHTADMIYQTNELIRINFDREELIEIFLWY